MESQVTKTDGRIEYRDPFKYRHYLNKILLGEDIDASIDQASPFNTVIGAITNSVNDLHHSLQKSLTLTNPILATVKEELFAFLSDRDEQYLFSTPAKTEFTIRTPIKDYLSNAVLNEETNMYSLTIPKFSKIVVDNIDFTLLYDITIDMPKQSDMRVYINYDIDDDTLIYGDQSFGRSSIILDNTGEEWIVFNAQFAQLSIAQYLSTSVAGTKFKQELQLDDPYFYSIIEIQRGGVYERIPKHYVDGVYDISSPSAYVNIGEDSVIYKIPQPFVDTTLNGNLRTTVFTTKGKILLDMRGYTNKDFSFVINKRVTNPKKVAAQGINIIASNTSIVDGGTDATKFQNIKSRIISRCSSRMDVPITEKQLMEIIRREGMVGEIVEDSLYNRLILAKQETWVPKVENASPTTFMNTVHMNKYIDPQPTINISREFIEFKPFTVFKRSGSLVEPITKTELDILTNKTKKELIKTLNSGEYFFNTFTTSIKNDEKTNQSKIYDELSPSITSFRLKNRNIYTPIKCAISTYNIERVGNSVKIKFNLVGNEQFKDIKEKFFIQLSFPTVMGGVHHTSIYMENGDNYWYEINISLASYIVDDKVTMTNGVTTNINRLVDITSDIKALVYTNDVSTYNSSDSSSLNYLEVGELQTDSLNKNVVCVSKHIGEMAIVKRLPFLWRKSSVNTLTKIYKTYEQDIPLRYTQDVYEVDSRTGSTYFIEDSDDDDICDTITRRKLHSIGDIVHDDNGDIVMAHKVGDYLLDNNGKPIETNHVNYEVITDMLMVDYRYKALPNTKFSTYLSELNSLFNNILTQKVRSLNTRTIDNTNIYFKPKNSIVPVKTTDGMEYNYLIVPDVTIYFDKDLMLEKDLAKDLNVSIGNIIRKYLTKKYFVLKDIEFEIEQKLTNVKVVDVVSFTPDKRRAFNITSNNAFHLGIKLNNIGDMEYDLNLNIKYI